MYTIRYSGQFKRSYKLCKKRGYDMSKLETVLRLLAETGSLPPQYHPHILSGKDWAGYPSSSPVAHSSSIATWR